MTERKFAKFYNTSYVQYTLTEDLEDNDFIRVEIYSNHNELPEEAKKLIEVFSKAEEFSARTEAYVFKKNIEALKEALGNIFADFSMGIFVTKTPKEGEMFEGWRGKPTKVTPEELPKSFVRVTHYKKAGYVDTAGVKSVSYRPSRITEESLKDDALVISYNENVDAETVESFDERVETFFGLDIVSIAEGIAKNSSIKTPIEKIRDRIDRICSRE